MANDTQEVVEDSPESIAESAESSPAPEAASETPSTDNGATPLERFNKLVEERETGKKATEEPPPPTQDEAADSAAETKTPENDGSEKGEVKAKEDEVSKEDAEFEKRFTERPEWKATQKLVAKGKEKEMRGIMRNLYQKQNTLHNQVDKLKPEAERLDRIRKRVGDEGVENTIRLIESWHDGDEHAEKLLTDLLTDLKARRGTVLSDPDLIQESKELDQQLADGQITPEWAQKRKGELLKLQRSEAQRRQSETRTQEVLKKAEHVNVQQLVSERTNAINQWEAGVSRNDPDYPKLQNTVIRYAKAAIAEKQGPNDPLLTPAEMVEVMQESYLAAKKDAKGWQAKPQPHTPVTGGTPSGNKRPAPRTPEERFNRMVDELEAKRG